MKIAVIGSKGLPPRQGGIEHHCAEIYPRIANWGHQVKVFARSSYSQLPWHARYSYEGIQVANLPSLRYRGLDALCNAALAAILASGQSFDIIHFHALGPALFSWVPRLLSLESRVVVTCHGLDWQRSKWGNLSSQLIRAGERTAVSCAHEIGVVSEDLQRYFKATYSCPTTCISNAPASYLNSDPDFTFGYSQGLTPGRYILFLGRLVPEKRPDLLIQAFHQSRPAGWRLVLAGATSDTSDYCKQLQRLAGANPDIHFCGELRGKRLAEIVRGAGLFVLPSELEGLPLALLEAMREGVPALASDIPVHRQLLGNDRGLLFTTGHVNNCAAALNWAIQNPDALKFMAVRAQHHIQMHHSWDRIAADWLTVYERLLGLPKTAVAISS